MQIDIEGDIVLGKFARIIFNNNQNKDFCFLHCQNIMIWF